MGSAFFQPLPSGRESIRAPAHFSPKFRTTYGMPVNKSLLIMILLCSGCAGIQTSDPKITGGQMVRLEKPGLFGSKGLRVVGERVRFVNGKCLLRLETANLPLQGEDWPYTLELRFYSSRSSEGVALESELARKILVKYRIKENSSEMVGGDYLANKWIKTGISFPLDYYYYAVGDGVGCAAYAVKSGVISVYLELLISGSTESEMFASVSLRTGGTK